MSLKIEKESDERIPFFTKLNKTLLKKVRVKKKKEHHTWEQIIEAGLKSYLELKKQK